MVERKLRKIMQSGICTVHCLRRRTSPRPYWIPLAAVDQNYKAEQRFGTSVRDSSPRYPLLPPRPRAFRAPPDRFRSICQTPSILFLHRSHPASLLLLRFFLGRSTPRVSRNHWIDGFRRVRWRVSRVTLHTLCPRCSARKGWNARLVLFLPALLPAGGLGDASKTCSKFHASE